ncbi:hypothetical protein P43SY_002776 [Pythium insidiosum]|uniref:SPRY domain-containing protein n=1 Tax=Pythium insidiosum TaxID=114742 RepID=A0AAD5LRS0_PYTIN|nr:hypothetical protein P43SY_002776 [Pythium insidiosum]
MEHLATGAAAVQRNHAVARRAGGSMRVFWVLMESSLLLDFLEPKDVIQAMHACYEKLMDQPLVFYQWIERRLQLHWSGLPQAPPREYLHPRVLLRALELLHHVTSFDFELLFDQARCGSRLRVRETETGSWCRTTAHGTVMANRCCLPDAVSYWECQGVTMGCFVGVAQELDAVFLERYGFHFGRHFDPRHDTLLGKKARACDVLPAIMYGQTGEITTGEFRGPRLALPAGLRSVLASPIAPTDVVGICVDLWQRQLVFFLNGVVQARIPLPSDRRYVPVFSCLTMTSSLFLHRRATPPWNLLYNAQSFQEEAQYLALQNLGKTRDPRADVPMAW